MCYCKTFCVCAVCTFRLTSGLLQLDGRLVSWDGRLIGEDSPEIAEGEERVSRVAAVPAYDDVNEESIEERRLRKASEKVCVEFVCVSVYLCLRFCLFMLLCYHGYHVENSSVRLRQGEKQVFDDGCCCTCTYLS